MFTPVPPKPDFPAQERDILRFWENTRAFEKLRQLRRGGPTWSFLDGPITANNPMGVHHAWGRTYKDLWQRYNAMRGFDQRWQNGFDCQGLWVEVNVEKDLGFKNKKDIEAYGLAEFIILCKQRVLEYAAIQTEQTMRLGSWMDWNDPDMLRMLRDRLGEDPQAQITVQGPEGPVTCTVEGIVGRLGLPELGGSYFTFSDKNNYDIWLFLKTCHDQGWIYKGTDVMPWCWRCGTAISQHEIVTEGYFEKQDPGLTVRFPLLDRPGESLLVWTTTPWTLTSNVVAAVGADLTYVKVRAPKAGGEGDEVLYLSKGTTHMLQGPYRVLEELPGKALEGWRYAGPFDELPAQQHPGGWAELSLRRLFSGIPQSAAQAHRVVLWDEVGEAEGTGIVHIAPGCGSEDFQLHKRDNLPVVAPLDENGYYIEGFDWLTGLPVAEVTDRIVAALKESGRFYRLEAYTHRYPQCWRCGTPLVFRLVDEWFISMDGLRQPLTDVTNQIQWVPEFGRERELDWLRNMHDWMISKKRYWGLALPIWECKACGHFEVIGSPGELKGRAIEGWDTFAGHTPHRPYIDAVVIACAQCGQPSHRIADVGNPWLDAGIVGLSTMRYGTDPAYWQKWYPADFITESFPGQFRNWFYSLLTMSTAVTGGLPTRAILGFGTLLAEDGSAMHKSAGNSIEFNEAADSPDFGADVMRWMFAAQRYDVDLLFGVEHAKDVRRRFLLPLWNVYTFFVTYANLDGWKPDGEARGEGSEGYEGPKGMVDRNRPLDPSDSFVTASALNSLDAWILARLNELIGETTAALNDYVAYRAVRAIEAFVDDLSNWYVRRSRRRYWKSEADADKNAAYSTLYQVLVTLSKLVAPIIPFTAEVIYQNLVRRAAPDAPESVHHCDWPVVDDKRFDRDLLEAMAIARTVVTLGHASRAGANLKVRQPLARAVVVVSPEQGPRLLRLADLVADELNVKSVELASNEAELITYRLQPNNKLLGPKYGQRFPQVRAALATVDPAAAVAALRSGQPLNLQVGDETLALTSEEVLVNPEPRPGFTVAAETGVVVALDIAITPELRAEGLAREVVRRIQDLRKTGGFDIADRVTTTYTASPDLAEAIAAYQDYIRAETLSVALTPGDAPGGAAVAADSFDGETVTVGLVKAAPTPTEEHPGARSAAEGEAAEQAIAADLAEPGAEAVPVIPEGHTPEARAKEAAKAAPRKRAGRGAGTKKAAAKKSTRKAAAKKTTRKAAVKTTAAKKKPAKKPTAKKASAKKGAAKKRAAKKGSSKKTVRRSAVKKTTRRTARKKKSD